MNKIVRIVDTLSEYTGRGAIWLSIALVLVLTYETTVRYVFNAPTQWAFETSYMIGASMAVIGWAYTHKHHGHIRVDIFYTRLSPKGQAIVDVVISILFLFPLLIVLIYGSYSSMQFAILMNEKLAESSFRPPAAPIKAVLLVGICLFALQTIAEFIRNLYLLIRKKTI
jgi:TRAP-type mannitol/chloroaromatic compound transport system permease small subunit